MFYPRTITPELIKAVDSKEIIVLTGMRQVGKTTLLKHVFDQVRSENKVFLDAENPLHRKIFEEENYDNIWRNLEEFGISQKERSYIFVDEVQLMPVLTSAVKYLHDHGNVKFFLTGSSSFYLKNLFPESLAGRKRVYELFQLTFAEFLVFRGKKRSMPNGFDEAIKKKSKVSYEIYKGEYKTYMERGGFPAAVLAENTLASQKKLEEIFTSYFEHDVKSLADFGDSAKLRDLILMLVPRIGSKVDISKLASELSVSRGTIYSYLAFLEQTYFISLLPRHSKSPDSRAAGNKKLYLCDIGLAQALGKMTEGQILEQTVYQALKPHHELSYYSRKRGKGEIDFVVDGKIALEVKTSATHGDCKNLVGRASDLDLAGKFLVSLNWNSDAGILMAQDI